MAILTRSSAFASTDFTHQLIADARYEVRERLGTGSMGHVFRAWDNRLETDVVLKVPTLARLENDEFRQRFLRESRYLVKLTHPRIVTILDVGEHEGVPYFVMQFIGGGSLETRIHTAESGSKPTPVDSLAAWLPGVAEALDFMHRQGYVHRDVKPGNILYDEHGHAYLSDFGLSKLVGGEDDDSSMTAAGAVVGTPNYVAPEVVLGLQYDGRADQYSLAMTVYEALTARCPLEGPSASATMVNQTAQLPPPLTKFAPGLPVELSKVVLRGLSKDPAARFPSCTAFAQAALKAASPPAPAKAAVSARSVEPAARPSAPSTSNRSSSRFSGVTDVLPQPQYTVLHKVKVRNLRATCPKCKNVLKLQPEFAGRKGHCKKCRSPLMISRDLKEIRFVKASRRAGNRDEFELAIATEVFGFRLSRKQTITLIGVLLFLTAASAVAIGLVAAQQKDERDREAPIRMNEGQRRGIAE